ncbi:cytochrome c [Chelativorans sp. AA-79]|uniref:c-type cytochrome n=1 Tax=Chelativorans sp. AA-79 TaxID=3028735 RepID=UPI0023F6F6F4|nr:cytochrome c [Chelativorans sp. AA-79]WEX11836.1 cytochrome c [Chelativorans sp. AA-79]
MQRKYRLITATALLLASLARPALAEDAQIARGRALVEANCSRCHAVSRDDASMHPEAPAFRTLWKRYPIDALEEAFAEGIYVGHPDMPEFIADPDQIAAIIAYIESIQD